MALGAALLIVTIFAAIGLAREEAKPDTGKVVTSISIGADGIVITSKAEDRGGADTLTIIDLERAATEAAARSWVWTMRLSTGSDGRYLASTRIAMPDAASAPVTSK